MELQEYETVMVADPDLSEEQLEDAFAKFENTIKQQDGILKKVEKWGLRNLAFKAKHKQRGYYVLLRYYGTPNVIEKLERNIKINDKIIRSLTIRISSKAVSDPIIESQVEEHTK